MSCFVSGSNSTFGQCLTCRALRWLWEQLDGTNVLLLGQNRWSQQPNGKRHLVGLVSIPAKSVSMTNVEIYRNVKLLSSFWLLISKCLYGVLQQSLPKCNYMDIWWWNLMYAETPLLKTIWGKPFAGSNVQANQFSSPWQPQKMNSWNFVVKKLQVYSCKPSTFLLIISAQQSIK